MTETLASGLLLGLSCGFAPGPLMALVVTQTLRHGRKEGCKIALVPIITDLPIIVLALLLAAKLAQFQTALGLLSLAGSAFVFYLAIDSLRPPRVDFNQANIQPKTWRKGILANLLNPSPWLFWFTIGAAMLMKLVSESGWAVATFLSALYAMLVGAKILVAILTDRSREFIKGKVYLWVLRTLGILLALFAVLLLRDGIRYLFPSP